MILAVDIGNTHTTMGLFSNSTLAYDWRTTSSTQRTSDEYGVLINQFLSSADKSNDSLTGIVISSVVPSLTDVFAHMSEKYLKKTPLIVSHKLDFGVPLLIDNPEQLGADRICNAVAGVRDYDLPLVVVDFGTATTFDILSVSGDYIGGIICPGPRTAVSNLAVQAAQLFDVEVEPPSGGVIAKNTEDAIKSGMFYGTLGEIEYLIGKIGEELGAKPTVIASGGLANTIANHSKLFDKVDPDLTLNGIRLIHEYQ